MGLFGALFAGVSGLDSQSNAIGVISNNISNVNTVGYKQGSAAFSTLVVPSGTTGFSPGGVIGSSNQLVSQQGLIEATSSATDIAITGGGLMVVSTTPSGTGAGNYLYTRAGSFTQDSSGNFVNADGYYLQGLPIQANGSTAQPETSNLVTVNVNQSQTGTATATSIISLAANLESTQTVYPGSSVTTTMSTQFGTSAANVGISGTNIVVGNDYDNTAPVSGLKRGNTLLITSGGLTTDTFTYGGFTVGRSVLLTPPGNDGDGGNTLNTLALTSAQIATTSTTTATTTTSTITGINLKLPTDVASGTGLFASATGTGSPLIIDGTTITVMPTDTLEGVAAKIKTALNTANGTNTSQAVINGSAGNYTLTVTDTGTGAGGGFTGAAVTGTSPTYTILPTVASPANTQMTITLSGGSVTNNVASGSISDYTVGQYLNISNVTGFGGLTTAQANGEFKIVGVNAATGTVTVDTGTPVTSGAGTNASSGTLTNRTFNFTGNIMNAKSVTDDFISPSGATTTSADFASDSLHFDVTIGSNPPLILTYSQSPDTAEAQFNNMTTLAAAINNSSAGTATATVVNGRLYVSAADANQSVTFNNGDAAGNSGLAGINWIQELDLQNQAGGTSGVFNSLTGLQNQINSIDPTNLTASLNNKDATASDAQLTITEANPEQTITFADGQALTSGSLLKEFGFDKINADPLTNIETTGPLPATYNNASALSDMSSGKVTPQHTFTVTVYDSEGNSHTLDLNLIKTGINTWAAELTAAPAGSVSITGRTDGQLAAGTLTFNGEGVLTGVSGSLGSTAIPITWTNGASPSSISLNLKNTDASTGITQDNANYSLSAATQNGAPVGQLTGVSIDENGYVVASFSNGQTQKEFQIPLANISNPNGLQAVSGNAYSVTLASGLPNLATAGSSGVGTFTPSALEESNVDLSTQLTNLIVAQQAYGANSKVLTIADTLLQELDQIIQG